MAIVTNPSKLLFIALGPSALATPSKQSHQDHQMANVEKRCKMARWKAPCQVQQPGRRDPQLCQLLTFTRRSIQAVELFMRVATISIGTVSKALGMRM